MKSLRALEIAAKLIQAVCLAVVLVSIIAGPSQLTSGIYASISVFEFPPISYLLAHPWSSSGSAAQQAFATVFICILTYFLSGLIAGVFFLRLPAPRTAKNETRPSTSEARAFFCRRVFLGGLLHVPFLKTTNPDPPTASPASAEASSAEKIAEVLISSKTGVGGKRDILSVIAGATALLAINAFALFRLPFEFAWIAPPETVGLVEFLIISWVAGAALVVIPIAFCCLFARKE